MQAQAYSVAPLVVRYELAGCAVLHRGGSRTWRLNNPGDLPSGAFALAHGSIGAAEGRAIFASAPAGRAALLALFDEPATAMKSVGALIAEFVPGYVLPRHAGRGGFEPASGLPLRLPTGALAPAQRARLADTVTWLLGYRAGELIGVEARVD
ncbi:hypothetical protein HUS23_03720 [Ectothiorhodospiraceae bacterium 2226]|nr:hypothetical protein HUS23_03720 [Ectothiorhodospiraceae bacterium 2226]